MNVKQRFSLKSTKKYISLSSNNERKAGRQSRAYVLQKSASGSRITYPDVPKEFIYLLEKGDHEKIQLLEA